MTRLSDVQKTAVLAARSRAGQIGAELVRIEDSWACVWREPENPPSGRWRGQLVKAVIGNKALAEFGVDQLDVWWTGGEAAGKKRKDVILQLRAEALV